MGPPPAARPTVTAQSPGRLGDAGDEPATVYSTPARLNWITVPSAVSSSCRRHASTETLRHAELTVARGLPEALFVPRDAGSSRTAIPSRPLPYVTKAPFALPPIRRTPSRDMPASELGARIRKSSLDATADEPGDLGGCW